ncbi:MAG TPA: serine hydrolase domain-containing protein [Burkholderiaceae bacterium]
MSLQVYLSARRRAVLSVFAAAAALCCAMPSALAGPLPADTASAIDAIVGKALKDTGVPSASIAIVKDGEIAYARAYGLARREPATQATAEMRYKIASNSKQMTASAILLLAEERKLALDDKVAKYLPKLTRARDITLRQLLSHSSGYSDYYAIDYLAAFMERDTTPQDILAAWAMKPLDFEPGSRYQYSNTNYIALGLVIEKVTGKPMMEFLRKRMFDKLGMKTVIDSSMEPWSAQDPIGHTRYGLGPVREVRGEAKIWMWSTGGMSMSASDLARWNIGLMDGKLLKPASMKALTTANLLSTGTTNGYSLGLNVSQMANGHRRWNHTGGASGFVSINTTYPDDRMAITVLTNGEGAAFTTISREIEKLLVTVPMDPDAPAALERAKQLFAGLQKGQFDRALVNDDLAGYFTPTSLGDFAAALGPLGEATDFTQNNRSDRGGMAYRIYTVKTPKKTLRVAAFVQPDGRFGQYLVSEQ